MASDAPRGGSVPLAGLMIVALLVGTTVFTPALFQLLRPSEPEGFRYELAKDQDIDARLWEDPFAVVRSYEENKSKGAKTPVTQSPDPGQCNEAHPAASQNALPDRHSACYFRERLASHFVDPETDLAVAAHRRTVLLGVMVQGYSFVGANEWHRRLRYAVIAGLNAAGYLPANSEQIGYFRTEVRAPAMHMLS